MKVRYLLIIAVLLISCGDQQHPSNGSAHAHTENTRYTCPMHPQVVQDHPGSCPICGMDLVKVTTTDTAVQQVMLSDAQIRLGNVTTTIVTRKSVGETLVVNGSLAVNQENTEVISSRAAGRVERLYVKETGQPVRKGEPLYVLYSETLLTMQSEYLLAKEQYAQLGSSANRYASFLKAAEEKLLRSGLTKAQVKRLDNRDSIQPRITFLSPASGIVTEINVLEGQYVEEGAPIYRTEDIGTLWVEAALYPQETAHVKTGDSIIVNIAGLPPKEAIVTFLTPEYKENSQITILRAEIQNEHMRLKPGQYAQILLTHSSRNALAIPPDAILRDERGSHVYIKSGENTFRPRQVETGAAGVNAVEVTSGIAEGDTVVVTGAYLLYSELMLKGHADAMTGHPH